MPSSNTDLGKRAILVTMIGDASMALLGLASSTFANSDAILNDRL